MAKRPTKIAVRRARQAQADAEPPIRFLADFDHVTVPLTIAYKAGHEVDEPSPALRAAALASGRAIEFRRGK